MWTEVGRKITLIGAMESVRSSSECAGGSQPPTLRLTARTLCVAPSKLTCIYNSNRLYIRSGRRWDL
jgi:hypothetical protein